MQENENLMLVEKAFEAQKNSYSPYSKYKVGAAVLTKSGKTYMGCNIENASFGATVCAERTAIFNAVSSGDKDIVKLALVCGDGKEFGAPCGMCRQVMSEFNEDLIVLLGRKVNNTVEYKEYKLSELLPLSFNSKDLEHK